MFYLRCTNTKGNGTKGTVRSRMTIPTNYKFTGLTATCFRTNHVDNPLTSSTVGSRINTKFFNVFRQSINLILWKLKADTLKFVSLIRLPLRPFYR